MAIDWSQEQLIDNDFNNTFAYFTPDQDGTVLASVQGQGTPTTVQLAWAYVGDSVVGAWMSGGNFLYNTDATSNYYANMEGNGSLPVAAGTTFALGTVLSGNAPYPFIYFWWVPAPAGSAAAGQKGRQASHEELRAVAEKSKPAAAQARRG